MRRFVLFSIFTLLLIGGCDCDDGENVPAEDTEVADADAAMDTGDDAAMDTGDDAVMDDANDADVVETGTVDLTFTDEGQALSNAPLFVHAPDGSVKTESTMDANGQASPTVTSGDMVTVATGTGGQSQVRYFTATQVEPGDVINIDVPTQIGQRLSDVEVTLPGPFQGIQEAGVYIGCNTLVGQDVSQPVTLAVRDTCPQGGDRFDVVAIVRNADNEAVAYAVQSDVERDQNGPTQVTLTSWETTFNTFEVTLDGFPDGAFTETDFETYADGVGVRDKLMPIQPGAGVTSQTFPFNYAPGYADAVEYSSFFGDSLPTFGNTATGQFARVSNPASNESVTVSADQLLPTFDTVEINDTSTPRPSLGWSTSPVSQGGPTVEEADGGLVRYQWADQTSGAWTVWIPNDATEVKFPELPSGVPAPSGSPAATQVFFYDLEGVSGYREFLSDPLTEPAFRSRQGFPNGRFTLGGEGT